MYAIKNLAKKMQAWVKTIKEKISYKKLHDNLQKHIIINRPK